MTKKEKLERQKWEVRERVENEFLTTDNIGNDDKRAWHCFCTDAIIYYYDKLTIEELERLSDWKLEYNCTKASEYISIHCRVSTWTYVYEGTLDTGKQIFHMNVSCSECHSL